MRGLQRIALLIAGVLAASGLPEAGAAQAVMQGVDLESPAMTEAEMSREEVAALLEAAKPGAPADLTSRRLNGLDLSGLDFTGAVLRAARLNDADLRGARFDGAVLDQAWLLRARLDGASLVGASLFQAQLWDASLRGADLTRARAPADFTRADLTDAVFAGASLGADLANQSMGMMRGVLTNARADRADFTDADLAHVVLEFADLREARLDGADLTAARLAGADLTGASVAGADFSRADVTSTRLVGLRGAETAKLDGAENLKRAVRE